MTRLGMVMHRHRPEVVDLARQALSWASGHDVVISMPTNDAELLGEPALGRSEEAFGPGLDACLSLGGDGTMLRASAMVSPYGVPILGVNAGHLGYLTEIEADELVSALDDWVAARYSIEERMLLSVDVAGSPPTSALALNEVVIDRAQSGHSVRVDAHIAGRFFTTYLVDGVIVATPTGSTAYSFSAGGPIVEPAFEAMILTPVSPHHVFNRSLVLSPRSEVTLTVAGYRSAVVVVDGVEVAELAPGESVTARPAAQPARLLVRQDRDFHSILKEKFGLSDR